MKPNAGTTPEINANQIQQVILPIGIYCDMGHVLGGMDACNHFAPVTPLPNILMFLRHLLPSVNSNIHIVTWLGDMASSASEFLYKYIETKKSVTNKEMQNIINDFAPGVL